MSSDVHITVHSGGTSSWCRNDWSAHAFVKHGTSHQHWTNPSKIWPAENRVSTQLQTTCCRTHSGTLSLSCFKETWREKDSTNAYTNNTAWLAYIDSYPVERNLLHISTVRNAIPTCISCINTSQIPLLLHICMAFCSRESLAVF